MKFVKSTLRMEWGAWFWYADMKASNLAFNWDGEISINKGAVSNLRQIEFWGVFGASRERLHPLPGNSWKSNITPRDNANLEGIIVDVDAPEDALITLNLKEHPVSFPYKDVLERKKLTYHIGPKYAGVDLNIFIDGYDEYNINKEEVKRLSQEDGRLRVLIDHEDFEGFEKREIFLRTMYAWTKPPSALKATFDLDRLPYCDENKFSQLKTIVKTCAASADMMEHPRGVREWIEYEIRINGQKIQKGKKHHAPFRGCQKMVEITFEIPPDILKERGNTIEIESFSEIVYLLVNQVIIEETIIDDLAIIDMPPWVYRGEKLDLTVMSLTDHTNVELLVPDGVKNIRELPETLKKGKYTFSIEVEKPLACAEIVVKSDRNSRSTILKYVVDVPCEKFPLCTGADLNILDTLNNEIDDVLEMFRKKRMGNYVLFRTEVNPTTKEDWARWSSLCTRNGIYFSIVSDDLDPKIYPVEITSKTVDIITRCNLAKEHGKDYFLGIHRHERSNLVYGWGKKDPVNERINRTMKDAMEKYLERMKNEFKHIPAGVGKVIGEAATTMHYDYLAGIDIVMAETMTGNSTILLAASRGAKKTFKKDIWGMHVACHIHKQPQGWEDGVMWSLNLCLGYMYGSNIIYDEESLLLMFHEKQRSLHDKLPRDRQTRMQKFNYWAQTHPRVCEATVNFAFLQGNLSVITGGLNVGKEKRVPVWGGLGPETDQFDYQAPENAWRYLDIFMPGVWLAPIQQDPSKIRRWLNGTPYGQVDLTPAFSEAGMLKEYKMAFLLDWNTMTDDIFANLKKYVSEGGNLLIGIPQLSTLTTRKHLEDMDELDLIYQGKGKIKDLFGVEILGKGNPMGKISFLNSSQNKISFDAKTAFSTNDTPTDDPTIHAAAIKNKTARVIAEDDTGHPVLIENKCGKGHVYLLTLWNYPGNERIENFMRSLITTLAKRFKPDIKVADKPDVNFSVYKEDGFERILFINTDWTEKGNHAACTASIKGKEIELPLRNDEITTVINVNGIIIVPEENDLFIEKAECKEKKCILKVHGAGEYHLKVFDFEDKFPLAFANGTPCTLTARGKAKIVTLNLNTLSTATVILEKKN